MTNTELLNFNFVDRENERMSANNFLKNSNETKILTIIGEKGVGKSFLLIKL